MTQKHEIFINTTEKYRLDKFLAEKLPSYSRSMVQNAIVQGLVKVNNIQILSAKHRLNINDECEIIIQEKAKDKDIATIDIDIEVIFADEHLAIINKPAGLTTHPGAGNKNHTVMNALYRQFSGNLSDIAGENKLGIVHRLDKETSGLMIIAKTNECHLLLAKQLQEHKILRIYRAFVYGAPKIPFGKIKTFVAKDKKNRVKMQTKEISGIKAITNYSVIETFANTFSLMEFQLETGRTHQIRVHMEHLKTPIIGDKLYGKKQNFSLRKLPEDLVEKIKAFPRHALHSYRLKFIHPISGKKLQFTCKMPSDMQELLYHIS